MTPAVKQQTSADWVGSDEKFPGLLANPLQVVQIAQDRPETLPLKDGTSPPHLIELLEKTPFPEDSVTTVVPLSPRSPRFKWVNLPSPCFPALIKWSPHTVLQQADTSLSVTREIILASVVWDSLVTATNSQEAPNTESLHVTIGLSVKNGVDASKTVDERNTFVGLAVKYGESEHSFSEEETQPPHQVDIHYTIPAETKVYVYQRKYSFICNLWFQVNTNDDQGRTVGPDTSPVRVSISTTIRTDEILFTGTKLKHAVAAVPVVDIDGPEGYGKNLFDVKKANEIVESIVKSAKQPAKH